MNNSSITFENPNSSNTIQFIDSSQWNLADWADFVYQNPYSDANVLNSFKNMGKLSFILEFLNEYYVTYKQFPHFFSNDNTFDGIQWIPLETRCQLISDFPNIFMALVQQLNENQKIELFKDFIDKEWCSVLAEGYSKIIQDVWSGPFVSTNHPSYMYIQFILDVLSDDQQKEVVNYFNSNLKHHEWVFFLLILIDLELDSDQYYALVFESDYGNNNFTEQCIDDILEAMDSPVEKHQSQKFVKEVLNHFFQDANSVDCLLEKFSDMRNRNQVYLLEVFNDEILNQIFDSYNKDFTSLATWCELIFENNNSFNERIRILKLLCNYIKEDSLRYFIKEILGTTQPMCGGYLFHCLPENTFVELIVGDYENIRKKIFDSMEIDSSIVQFLETWHQHPSKEALEQVMTLNFSWSEKINEFQMIDDNVMNVIEEYTIDRCFEKLLQLFTEPEVIEIHEPFIHQIPPVLMAMLAKDEFRRDILFSLAIVFTDKQLQFLMVPFWDNFYDTLHQLTDHKIRLDQIVMIFLSLSSDQFHGFVDQKITFLKSSMNDFTEKMKHLDLKINEIISNSSIIQYYDSLQKNLLKIHAIMESKKSSTMEFKELDLFMMEIDKIQSNYPNKKNLNAEFEAKLLEFSVNYLNSDQDSLVEFLILEIDKIKSQFLIEQHEFDLLEAKLLELRAIYMRSEHLTCKAIKSFFNEYDDYSIQFIEFKNIQNCLKNKELLINEKSRVRKNLDVIETYIDQKDKPSLSVTELLPEWFWVLIRSHDLTYFKSITHFEELQGVGIR
ncbi:MAG: hypothetical protein Q8K60_07050, partial [Parachlamydiaceae bacterium]|nr:hypothetical protein [Parachlamydiaceae bacterium]